MGEIALGSTRPVTGSLGLASGAVYVRPYDAAWPELYRAEVARVETFLSAEGIDLVFEHTGSTAISGMRAKPVIDILAGMPDPGVRQRAVVKLQMAGYVYRVDQEIETRDFFRRGEPRKYHLHLTAVGSSFWRDHLAFRDFLRSNPETATAYALLKTELAVRYPRDRAAYIAGKTAFVEEVLRRGGDD